MSIIFTFTSYFMSSFAFLVKLLSSFLVIWLNSVGKMRQDLLTVDDVEIFNIKFNLPVDLSIQRHTRGGIRGDYRGLNRRQRFTLAVSKRPHGLCEHLLPDARWEKHLVFEDDQFSPENNKKNDIDPREENKIWRSKRIQ